MAPEETVDLALLGGGLANGLVAYRLAQTRPGLRVRLIETGPGFGGNHTWCFFRDDLTAAQNAWVDPFVAHRWDGYEVCFPELRRRLDVPYAAITAARFDAVLRGTLPPGWLMPDSRATVTPQGLRAGDRPLAATAILDGRGPAAMEALDLGWQKFLGLEVELAAPHGLVRPVIMDATVPQLEGDYRFLYLLPLGPDRLLVEDTRYAPGPALDAPALRAEVHRYIEQRGWQLRRVLREETGVLPVALGGDAAAFLAQEGGLPRSGLRGALFHPTTGYSLPDAVRLADRIAAAPDLSAPALLALVRDHALALWRERGFYRLLNRMLFRAALPGEGYRVLQRFYGLPEGLIGRFYAARSSLADKARILAGRPPVPLGRALRCLGERRPA